MELTTTTIVATVTLALFAFGGIATVIVWVRRSGAFAGLAALFTLGVVRQIAVLLGDPPAAPPTSIAWLAELALPLVALGAIAALRALHRTTAERDRIEDLHWDSMESVRSMSELSARAGGHFDAKLATLLELGTTRFGLEQGIAWLRDDDGERVLGLYSEDGPTAEEVVAALEPQLRQAADASRPLSLALDSGNGQTRAFLATPLRLAGVSRGALAFVGDATRTPGRRFGASDKDLLGLMAQWLSTEIERSERAKSPPVREAPQVARRRPRRLHRASDLNEAVRAAEPRLRREVGADATLTIDLDPALPTVRPGGVPLPRLVESLVLAAVRLAPCGRISVETCAPSLGAPARATHTRRDVLLVVRVEDCSLAGDALDRVFGPAQDALGSEPERRAIPLPRLERSLRRSDGDLSASLEPGRCATLTAFLPAAVQPRRDSSTSASASP